MRFSLPLVWGLVFFLLSPSPLRVELTVVFEEVECADASAWGLEGLAMHQRYFCGWLWVRLTAGWLG